MNIDSSNTKSLSLCRTQPDASLKYEISVALHFQSLTISPAAFSHNNSSNQSSSNLLLEICTPGTKRKLIIHHSSKPSSHPSRTQKNTPNPETRRINLRNHRIEFIISIPFNCTQAKSFLEQSGQKNLKINNPLPGSTEFIPLRFTICDAAVPNFIHDAVVLNVKDFVTEGPTHYSAFSVPFLLGASILLSVDTAPLSHQLLTFGKQFGSSSLSSTNKNKKLYQRGDGKIRNEDVEYRANDKLIEEKCKNKNDFFASISTLVDGKDKLEQRHKFIEPVNLVDEYMDCRKQRENGNPSIHTCTTKIVRDPLSYLENCDLNLISNISDTKKKSNQSPVICIHDNNSSLTSNKLTLNTSNKHKAQRETKKDFINAALNPRENSNVPTTSECGVESVTAGNEINKHESEDGSVSNESIPLPAKRIDGIENDDAIRKADNSMLSQNTQISLLIPHCFDYVPPMKDPEKFEEDNMKEFFSFKSLPEDQGELTRPKTFSVINFDDFVQSEISGETMDVENDSVDQDNANIYPNWTPSTILLHPIESIVNTFDGTSTDRKEGGESGDERDETDFDHENTTRSRQHTQNNNGTNSVHCRQNMLSADMKEFSFDRFPQSFDCEDKEETVSWDFHFQKTELDEPASPTPSMKLLSSLEVSTTARKDTFPEKLIFLTKTGHNVIPSDFLISPMDISHIEYRNCSEHQLPVYRFLDFSIQGSYQPHSVNPFLNDRFASVASALSFTSKIHSSSKAEKKTDQVHQTDLDEEFTSGTEGVFRTEEASCFPPPTEPGTKPSQVISAAKATADQNNSVEEWKLDALKTGFQRAQEGTVKVIDTKNKYMSKPLEEKPTEKLEAKLEAYGNVSEQTSENRKKGEAKLSVQSNSHFNEDNRCSSESSDDTSESSITESGLYAIALESTNDDFQDLATEIAQQLRDTGNETSSPKTDKDKDRGGGKSQNKIEVDSNFEKSQTRTALEDGVNQSLRITHREGKIRMTIGKKAKCNSVKQHSSSRDGEINRARTLISRGRVPAGGHKYVLKEGRRVGMNIKQTTNGEKSDYKTKSKCQWPLSPSYEGDRIEYEEAKEPNEKPKLYKQPSFKGDGGSEASEIDSAERKRSGTEKKCMMKDAESLNESNTNETDEGSEKKPKVRIPLSPSGEVEISMTAKKATRLREATEHSCGVRDATVSSKRIETERDAGDNEKQKITISLSSSSEDEIAPAAIGNLPGGKVNKGEINKGKKKEPKEKVEIIDENGKPKFNKPPLPSSDEKEAMEAITRLREGVGKGGFREDSKWKETQAHSSLFFSDDELRNTAGVEAIKKLHQATKNGTPPGVEKAVNKEIGENSLSSKDKKNRSLSSFITKMKSRARPNGVEIDELEVKDINDDILWIQNREIQEEESQTAKESNNESKSDDVSEQDMNESTGSDKKENSYSHEKNAKEDSKGSSTSTFRVEAKLERLLTFSFWYDFKSGSSSRNILSSLGQRILCPSSMISNPMANTEKSDHILNFVNSSNLQSTERSSSRKLIKYVRKPKSDQGHPKLPMQVNKRTGTEFSSIYGKGRFTESPLKFDLPIPRPSTFWMVSGSEEHESEEEKQEKVQIGNVMHTVRKKRLSTDGFQVCLNSEPIANTALLSPLQKIMISYKKDFIISNEKTDGDTVVRNEEPSCSIPLRQDKLLESTATTSTDTGPSINRMKNRSIIPVKQPLTEKEMMDIPPDYVNLQKPTGLHASKSLKLIGLTEQSARFITDPEFDLENEGINLDLVLDSLMMIPQLDGLELKREFSLGEVNNMRVYVKGGRENDIKRQPLDGLYLGHWTCGSSMVNYSKSFSRQANDENEIDEESEFEKETQHDLKQAKSSKGCMKEVQDAKEENLMSTITIGTDHNRSDSDATQEIIVNMKNKHGYKESQKNDIKREGTGRKSSNFRSKLRKRDTNRNKNTNTNTNEHENGEEFDTQVEKIGDYDVVIPTSANTTTSNININRRNSTTASAIGKESDHAQDDGSRASDGQVSGQNEHDTEDEDQEFEDDVLCGEIVRSFGVATESESRAPEIMPLYYSHAPSRSTDDEWQEEIMMHKWDGCVRPKNRPSYRKLVNSSISEVVSNFTANRRVEGVSSVRSIRKLKSVLPDYNIRDSSDCSFQACKKEEDEQADEKEAQRVKEGERGVESDSGGEKKEFAEQEVMYVVTKLRREKQKVEQIVKTQDDVIASLLREKMEIQRKKDEAMRECDARDGYIDELGKELQKERDCRNAVTVENGRLLEVIGRLGDELQDVSRYGDVGRVVRDLEGGGRGSGGIKIGANRARRGWWVW